jgi:hypothetical protein
MTLRLGLLVLAAAIVSQPGFAQGPVVYERWPFYERYVKPLPPGFHDFIPVPASLSHERMPSEESVLCREWRNAISFGKRIALGMSPPQAVDDIARELGGEMVCGFVRGLTLAPLRYAVRGDDAGRAILIFEWRDQYGRFHYSGTPRA